VIISHLHRFIFVKSKKTAGTSVESALAEHCGPRDVLTSLSIDGTDGRVPGSGRAKNDDVPLRGYTPRMIFGAVKRGRRLRFYNHYRAADIARAVGPKIWHEYLTFTIERNPYDRSISRYWFDNPVGGIDMLAYFQSLGSDLSNWGRYSIHDRVAVDRVLRYETLADDLRTLGAEIGINIMLPASRLKGGFRADHRHYSEILKPVERNLIERVCAREFETFGYSWD
jgi:hypothetical protein